MRQNHQLLILFALVLIVTVGLIGGCGESEVSVPTPAMEEVVAEQPLSSSTPTLIPATQTPTPTTKPTNAVPTQTATSLAAWTRPPAPPSTPKPINTPFPNLIWSEQITKVTSFSSNVVNWSTMSNKLLIDNCSWSSENKTGGKIFMASGPDFEAVNITPENFTCSHDSSYLQWNPDENVVIFYGYYSLIESYYPNIWMMHTNDLIGKPVDPENIGYSFLNILGWMDNNSIAVSGHCGSGCSYAMIVNIISEEILSSGSVNGIFFEPTSRYIAANNGMDKWSSVSAIILSTEIENELSGLEGGPHIRFLSLDYTPTRHFEFNSHFEDWLPGSNKMLVATWERNKDLYDYDFLHSQSVTNLQLWDVPTDELTMLVPGGIYGRFSPDGKYLANLTTKNNYPILQLYESSSSTLLFSHPSSAIQAGHYNEIMPYFFFSPDNQYFAFFTPDEIQIDKNNYPLSINMSPNEQKKPSESFLNIFNLTQNQVVFSQPLSPSKLYWSPNGNQFIFQDNQGEFNIFDIDNKKSFAISTSGSYRLSNPQWSFDGSYLSISVQNEDEWETVILQLTNP